MRWDEAAIDADRYSGSECWAGQSLGGSAADVSTCNMACSGDASSKCGGSNRLSLYAVRPTIALRHG